MHRSGSSFLAGILHKSGIVMGEKEHFWPNPNSENAKGFFENYRFRSINDRLLEHSAYVVKQWNPRVPKVGSSYLQRWRIRKLLREYSRNYSHWGWKDPRQCLTNSIWLEACGDLGMLERVKTVVLFRNPLSVAKSLLKRENTRTLAHGLALWHSYMTEAMQSLKSHPVPYCVLSFDKLRESPAEELSRLSGFLGKKIPISVFHGFYSPTLVRSESGTVAEHSLVESAIEELYKGFLNASDAGAGEIRDSFR